MRLGLEQRLEFKLAPLLRARLDILQLPQLELREVLMQKIEQNPFLEREPEEEELPLPEDLDDWDKYPKSVEYKPENRKPLVVAPVPTLQEYLISQLRIAVKGPGLIDIGEHIIYSLNDDGFLPVTVEELAKSLKEDPAIVELMLQRIQNFDPVGVASRDVRECLLVQLRAKMRVPKIAILILERFFQEFLKGNYKKIMNTLKVLQEELKEAIETIKSCRPKPARSWGGRVRYVLPDIVIERQDDEWNASLVSNWIPKLRLAASYRRMLQDPSKLKRKELDYLKEKYRDAKLLIEGIEKRRETLTAIANYIVKKELKFLNHKTNSFEFLTLQEVAQAIKRDPSTVSRAIKGKWIQTPDGALELKSLFSRGRIKSYPEIAHRIKELVEKEDKSNPLKDQEIINILKKEGHKVARTTIVKYRTQLGILGANKRKTQF